MRSFISSQFTPKLFTLLRSGYSLGHFRSDTVAGLTVAIVALPLAMALAIASGASPEKGLLTAVVAGFMISFLGGSRVQIGGPTGAFVVVVFNVIATHGYDGLILATLLAGIMLVIAGYARLGQIIKFIPHPVVTGFTAGIAIIIATAQVKDFLGLRIEDVPADFISKWSAYWGALNTLDVVTLIVGISSLVFIILLRRFCPKWPSYLVVIVLATALVSFLGLAVDTIGTRFPDMPKGLSMPSIPVWSFAKLQEVVPAAFTIAFLAGIEALLSAVVADGMTGYKHRSNQELVAQGAANIASAMFGGLPAAGAIARTATNVKAGGLTPVAGIMHALFVLLFVLFASGWMKYVPMAVLASILFVVAWGMSEVKHFIHIYKLSLSERSVMVLTLLLTVFVDLTVAISVGVTLASLLFMYRMSASIEIHSHGRKVVHASDVEEEEESSQREELPEGVEVFRIAGPVFFGVAGDLLDALKRIGSFPKVLVVRMRLVPYLDATGTEVIESIVKECYTRGTKVILSGLQKQPMEIIKHSDLMDPKWGLMICAHYAASLKAAQAYLSSGQ